MAGIDNLKLRIISDDREKANKIESEARIKAEGIIEAAREKAQLILEEVKPRAEKDGRDRKDRIISRAQLDARNSILSAKQQTIDNVLSLVIDRIYKMDNKEYSSFVEKLLLNSVETGEEEIIFSEADKLRIDNEIVDKVNEALMLRGKKGMLRVSGEVRSVPSGFILKRGGLEINCSVESRIRILRDDLEADLANLLFEGR